MGKGRECECGFTDGVVAWVEDGQFGSFFVGLETFKDQLLDVHDERVLVTAQGGSTVGGDKRQHNE